MNLGERVSRILLCSVKKSDQGHLLAHRDENRIFNSAFDHPHQPIKTVECKRRIDPWRSEQRVITHGYEEGDITQQAGHISACRSQIIKFRDLLDDPEYIPQVSSHGP